VTWLLALPGVSACSESQDAEPAPEDDVGEEGVGEQAGEGEGGAEGEGEEGGPPDGIPDGYQVCGIDVWPSPDAERATYECSGVPERWWCRCAGRETEGPADTCEAALRAFCQVDPETRTYCREGDVGTCWPSDEAEDAWSCRCGEEGPADRAARDERCKRALWTACGEACEDRLGRCEPEAGFGEFTCRCSTYGERPRHRYGPECERALRICNPLLTDPPLSFNGYCDQVGDGCDCWCVGGEAQHFRFEDLGHDHCPSVLEDFCRDVEPPADLYCADEWEGGRGECSRGMGERGPDAWMCSCRWWDGQSAGAGGREIEDAAGCAEALRRACRDGQD